MGKYTNLGCFKDHSSRAIAGGFVRYAPSTAIYQCYQKALRLGNKYFAVQYNTECFTHRDAGRTYAKYGRANGCRNGRGGGWKMNVYRINGPVSAPVRTCSVEIFEHANYHGGREVYRGDVRRVRHNDRMSSLKVPTGCCLTIYEHYNFGGRNHRYCSQNVGFVGGWWNDRVSSLKVSGRAQVPAPVRACSVEIFEHANYHGGREVYRGDVRRVRHNDRMSSLKVPTGCCLTIYEHYNFGGRNHRYCSQNVGFVGGWWNDRVSSLSCADGSQPKCPSGRIDTC